MANQLRNISFPALRIQQPIGDFFVGVMSAQDVVAISYADVREIENSLDSYMGIQRRLSAPRVKELQAYVNTYDATFPTAIILAVEEDNVRWDEKTCNLTLIETNDVSFDKLARIIDGQHRVEGLRAFDGGRFEVNVAVFIGADFPTQANIFATVNLAQTKVNRSLVYDLFDYQRDRSPQKSAHIIAVALDQIDGSPFYHRIKRLGTATHGREKETLTQAAVVEALLKLISQDPMGDRDSFLKKIGISRPSAEELESLPFRELFRREREADITKIMLNYFSAVREKWPESWGDAERQGNVLPRTNGFRALMRFFKPSYLQVVKSKIGTIPEKEQFADIFALISLGDEDFNIKVFPPGTGGEAALLNHLVRETFPELER